MSLPADFIVAQGVVVYSKATLQPQVVRCNCSQTPQHLSARWIQSHKDDYYTPTQFVALQSSGIMPA